MAGVESCLVCTLLPRGFAPEVLMRMVQKLMGASAVTQLSSGSAVDRWLMQQMFTPPGVAEAVVPVDDYNDDDNDLWKADVVFLAACQFGQRAHCFVKFCVIYGLVFSCVCSPSCLGITLEVDRVLKTNYLSLYLSYA